MRFAAWEYIHLGWLGMGLVFFLIYAHRRYDRKMRLFVEKDFWPSVTSGFRAGLKQKQMIWTGLACFFVVCAMMRPQWGFEWQEVKRKGIDLLIVVDTSKSMLTQDVKPNRLERTKLAVKDLIKRLNGDRVGLIAFAGNAFLMCPLTVDYDGFKLSLDELNTHSVPRGGTNISRAIQESLNHYEEGSENYRAVIIVTDGDNLEGNPLKVAKEAAERGVKIYTIGIGTRAGELIQVNAGRGSTDFLKDAQGNYVKSRLNEQLLQDIALETGGVYVKSSGAEFGLDVIYDQYLSRLEKREFDSQQQKKYYERFQFPLALGLLCLFIETCLGIGVRNKDEA